MVGLLGGNFGGGYFLSGSDSGYDNCGGCSNCLGKRGIIFKIIINCFWKLFLLMVM